MRNESSTGAGSITTSSSYTISSSVDRGSPSWCCSTWSSGGGWGTSCTRPASLSTFSKDWLRSQGTGSGSWKSKGGIFDLRSVTLTLESSWDLFLFCSLLEVEGGECLCVGGLAGALSGNLGLEGAGVIGDDLKGGVV